MDGLPETKAVPEHAHQSNHDDQEGDTFKLTMEGDSIALEPAKACVDVVSQQTFSNSKRVRSIPLQFLSLLKNVAEQLQQ